MRKVLLIIIIAVSSLSAFSQSINELKTLFDYDKSDDVNFRILASRDSLQATINSVSFLSVNGLNVTGTLIIPKQNLRRFPVIIFLNDGYQPGDQFLEQAIVLAGNAIASFIMDPMPQRVAPFWYDYYNFKEPRKDFALHIQSVMDVRRCIDALEQHIRINRDRIAFIGNGSGAMTGAILSSLEPRITLYILMGCSSSYAGKLKTSNEPDIARERKIMSPDQISLYEQVIRPINPSNYLPYHQGSLVFYQYAQSDPYFIDSDAKTTINLTKEPKTSKFYNTDSKGLFTTDEAVNDRLNWLKDHL